MSLSSESHVLSELGARGLARAYGRDFWGHFINNHPGNLLDLNKGLFDGRGIERDKEGSGVGRSKGTCEMTGSTAH